MQNSSWQTALSNLITDPQELLELLNLDLTLLPKAKEVANFFPLRVTREFVTRMQKGNLEDPLLKQVLPLHLELKQTEGFDPDPLQEKKVNPLPGLLHKFKGRVLLTITSACAIHCRYCFRREFPYEQNNPGSEGWKKVLAYIAADSTINEVILSGGDPLAASDTFLEKFTQQLAAIPHLKILRIHTRMPIVLPQRINSELLTWFTATQLQPVMVIHCNHPDEIDAQVLKALNLLRQKNVTLLNQSVLLKGINDSATVLIELSQKLFAAGVLPYYLNLLDKVTGAAHFEVDQNIAAHLMREVMSHLPGYLVPKLVREKAGEPFKISLFHSEKQKNDDPGSASL